MNDVVIRVKNVSKEYRLGIIGHGTLSHDLQSLWAKIWGKEDPNLKIDEFRSTALFGDDNRFQALNNISFDIHEGEIVGIIGRNGAGKSTILKILSRVTAPTSGNLKIKGRIASLLEVGTGFHPELTGRENIFLNGAILGMKKSEIDSKYDEIVEFSGVKQFIDTPVKRYSSGMYVRLAFAVAAHLETDIMIVDEVLAVGDAEFQKKCLGKMQGVAKGGRTILFVSHSMPSVESICTRVIWIDNGIIVQDGSTKAVISEYINFCNTHFLKRKVGEYENLGPRRGTGELQFNEFQLLNEDGNKTSTYYPGEQIWMKVSFEVFKEVDDAFFAYGIYEGTSKVRIARWRQSKPTKKYYSGEKGIFSLKIKNNSLGVGNYFFQLIINESNPDKAYDVWDGSGTEFSIINKTSQIPTEEEDDKAGSLLDISGIVEVTMI